MEFLCSPAQPEKLGGGLSSGWLCCPVYSCSWTPPSVLQSKFRIMEARSYKQDLQWSPAPPEEWGRVLAQGKGVGQQIFGAR